MSHYDYIMLVHLLICHRRRRRESWLWHNKNFFFQFLVQNCDIFDHEKRKFFGPKLRYFLVLNCDIFWILDCDIFWILDCNIFFGPRLRYFLVLDCNIFSQVAIFWPGLLYLGLVWDITSYCNNFGLLFDHGCNLGCIRQGLRNSHAI